jgi:hypothetical protein
LHVCAASAITHSRTYDFLACVRRRRLATASRGGSSNILCDSNLWFGCPVVMGLGTPLPWTFES